MAGFSSGVIGIAAVAMTFGAAFHFEQASGTEARDAMARDTMLRNATSVALLRSDGPVSSSPVLSSPPSSRASLDHGVNRTAKSDRLAAPQPAASPYRTLMVTLVDMADTSVLVRIPVAASKAPRAPADPPRGTLKPDEAAQPPVACEAVASVMTEAARVIGRCLT